MFRELLLEFGFEKSKVYGSNTEYEDALKKVYKGISNIKSITFKNSDMIVDTDKGIRKVSFDKTSDAARAAKQLNTKLDMINKNLGR